MLERTDTGYSAWAPDVPGCVSTGASKEAVVASMREAVAFHIEGLREDGLAVPSPSARSSWVEITP